MKRTLVLRREALTDLSAEDLARVNGAADDALTSPFLACAAALITDAISRYYSCLC